MNRAVGLDTCCIALVVGYVSFMGWIILANLNPVLETSAWATSLGLLMTALVVIGMGSFLLRLSDKCAERAPRRICVNIVGCILIGICCGTFWGVVVLAHLQFHFDLFDSVWVLLGLYASIFISFVLGLFVLLVLTEMVPDDDQAPDKEVQQREQRGTRSSAGFGTSVPHMRPGRY